MSRRGLSEAGVARLHEVLSAHVDGGSMPGLAALVACGDDVHVEVLGTNDFGDTRLMPRNAVFRIASITKPIAAVAAMQLVDDGAIALDEPVDRLLPELADRRVLRRIDGPIDDTVAAHRPITVRDLLTFRLGLGAPMVPPGTYPIQQAEEELQLSTLGPPWPPPPHGNDEWIRRLGTLPLMYQPGERWMYNTGAQVLGVLIERAAGRPLDAHLRERLFDPLGMADTGFWVRPDQLDRFTTAYAPDPSTGEMRLLDGVEGSFWSEPPAMPNMAGWLLSTLDDVWSFARMMSRRGEADGGRIVSAESFELMVTDQLTPEQREQNSLFFPDGDSWGLGLAVPAAGVAKAGVPRGIGWDGGTGTTWRTDLESGLTGILLTQRAMTSPQPPAVFTDFWRAAYDAAVTD